MNHQVAEDITDKVHAAIRKQTTDDELIRADEELIRADDEREKRRIREDREAFDREHPGWRERQAKRDEVKAREAKERAERDEEFQQLFAREKLVREAKARQLQRQRDDEEERRRADPVWVAHEAKARRELDEEYKERHCKYPWGKMREYLYPTNEDNHFRKYPNEGRGRKDFQFVDWVSNRDPKSRYNTGFGVKQ
jgi:hypothetical protein